MNVLLQFEKRDGVENQFKTKHCASQARISNYIPLSGAIMVVVLLQWWFLSNLANESNRFDSN